MIDLEVAACPTAYMDMQKHYTKGSEDRQKLADAVAALKSKAPLEVPIVVAGKEVFASSNILSVRDHH